MQEALEGLDLGDAVEEGLGVDRGHGRAKTSGLDRESQPLAFFGHEDLREVVARPRAVGLPQGGEGRGGIGLPLGQRPAHDAGRQVVELLLGDAVAFGGQRRISGRAGAQRVDLRGEVPVAANRLDQRRRTYDGADVGARYLARRAV